MDRFLPDPVPQIVNPKRRQPAPTVGQKDPRFFSEKLPLLASRLRSIMNPEPGHYLGNELGPHLTRDSEKEVEVEEIVEILRQRSEGLNNSAAVPAPGLGDVVSVPTQLCEVPPDIGVLDGDRALIGIDHQTEAPDKPELGIRGKALRSPFDGRRGQQIIAIDPSSTSPVAMRNPLLIASACPNQVPKSSASGAVRPTLQ